jgi:voltage-gated potassium channel
MRHLEGIHSMKRVWRDFSIILSAVWINLLLFVAMFAIAAILLHQYGPDPQAGWAQLVLDAFNLASMERVETGGHTIVVVMAFVLPVAMSLILGEGILRVFSIYSQRNSNRKEWDLMLVKSLKDHMVLCGAGEMGRQILQQMLLAQPDLKVVILDPRPALLAELGLDDSTAVHFQADMTSIESLEQAHISSARLVILTAGEDAVNLESAYKVLRLNPAVPVWVRLHHSELADLLDLSRNAHIHFFCPYQQAARSVVDHILQE